MALGEARAEPGRKTPATNDAQASSKTLTGDVAKASLTHRVAFMAGKDDFRAARTRAALACEEYNRLSEGATAEERIFHWMKVVNPNHKSREAAIIISYDFDKTKESQTSTEGSYSSPDTQIPRPSGPYIKSPIHIDYGLRLRIAPTTFINRNCFILDTPVADITIGENCTIGPNVTIIGVGHPIMYEDRCEFVTGKAGSWGAKVEVRDGVWVGAGVTILPGVTIGEYSTIAAGSIVTKDIPARCMAAGHPATVRYFIEDRKAPIHIVETAMTLEDALKISHTSEVVEMRSEAGEGS